MYLPVSQFGGWYPVWQEQLPVKASHDVVWFLSQAQSPLQSTPYVPGEQAEKCQAQHIYEVVLLYGNNKWRNLAKTFKSLNPNSTFPQTDGQIDRLQWLKSTM